jgi:hypothetical protein
MKPFLRLLPGALWFAFASSAQAAVSVDPYYAGSYSLTVLGSAPGVPANYGGLTTKLDDPSTLLLGGAANTQSAKIYSVPLERDASGHITGFGGAATAFAAANGTMGGGIDGGLAYEPGGVLFYTAFFDNQIGQIEPGSVGPDKIVNLSPGVTRSVGGLGFVPAGMPGAGRLKITSTLVGRWYDATVTPDGSGTYNITRNTGVAINIGGGPQGIVYVPPGSLLFPTASVLVAEFQAEVDSPGRVVSYRVNANGDPIPGTRRTFIDGLEGAEGATIDPLTGDFLFSTYSGGDLIVRVSAIPEPDTCMLLALGLAILGAVRQRERTFGPRSSGPSLTNGLAKLGRH